MKDTALYFLHQVAENNPKNQFAKAIFNRFNEAGDDVDLKTWQLLDTDLDNIAQLGDYDPSQIERNQDFRFLFLYLRAVRKYPPLPEDNFYSISFCCEKNEEPKNTLLQGRNGTGKTSVFDALEYLFTRNVSAATKMGFTSADELKDYMHYAGSSYSNVNIGVITKFSHFTLSPLDELQKKDVRRLCLLPFFCSEYDVDRLIGSNYNENKLTTFIYEQMGYGLVKWIIDQVKKEIDAAKLQHEELVSISDGLESQVDDLDKRINMNERLRHSLVHFAEDLRSSRIAKEDLNTLIDYLSKEIVKNKELENEKTLVIKTFGENSPLVGMYTEWEVIQNLKNKTTQDSSLGIPSNANTANTDEALSSLKYARNSLSLFIGMLLEKGEDIDSALIEFDNLIQNQKKEKESKKNLLNKNSLLKNMASYDEFWMLLKEAVYKAVEENTKKACEMINEIMNLFVMEDEKMQFSFNRNNGTFSMGITLYDSDGTPLASFTPEKYLNTFRYKLYCMSLKMAIAFAMKRFYQINFPIVIDDIFYSSDFTHRSMVRTYFRILFKKHKELFPKPEDELQVIFLSHDEVIIEAAFRGIRDANANANRHMLFDYRDADTDNEIIGSTNNGQRIKMISLTCSL